MTSDQHSLWREAQDKGDTHIYNIRVLYMVSWPMYRIFCDLPHQPAEHPPRSVLFSHFP